LPAQQLALLTILTFTSLHRGRACRTVAPAAACGKHARLHAQGNLATGDTATARDGGLDSSAACASCTAPAARECKYSVCRHAISTPQRCSRSIQWTDDTRLQCSRNRVQRQKRTHSFIDQTDRAKSDCAHNLNHALVSPCLLQT